MAKKIQTTIKLKLARGQGDPGAAGRHRARPARLDIMDFCRQFNAKTAKSRTGCSRCP